MMYDLVSTLASEEVHIMDLLDPAEVTAIHQENRTMNIFSCRESAPLEHLFNCCRVTETNPTLPAAHIERLEFVVPAFNNLMMSEPGLHWEEGVYGLLASHHSARTSQALTKSLRSTQERLSSANERALGALVIAGVLNEVEDPVHAKDVTKLFADTFQGLHISGCVVGISVGPIALLEVSSRLQ